jgi:carboxyl-terminal processing protease
VTDHNRPRRMEIRRRGPFEYALLGVLALTVAGVTLAIAQRGGYEFFDPIIEVHAHVSRAFVSEPDAKAMQLGAIEGMLDAIDDPHTLFVPPGQRREFDVGLTGNFVGIGVQVVTRDGWLTVVTPIEDTPAYRAGLLAGDRIVEVEGTSTFNLSAAECVRLLSGEPGTRVGFIVERGGERLPFTVERARLSAPTVKGIARRPDAPDSWRFVFDEPRSLAYVRISQFTETTAADLRAVLDALGASAGSLGGLILDLRANPGGLLDAAIEIADLFLPSGAIVTTSGRAHRPETRSARAPGTLPDFPLVLLINGQSASASEVLAGALIENNRAVAVGTRTFGKASVQAVHPIAMGRDDAGRPLVGELKITEQYYLLPSGRSLHRAPGSMDWGVDPTDGFHVAMSENQVAQVLRRRQEQDIIRPAGAGNAAGREHDPSWLEAEGGDPQLAAAVRALVLRHDTGAWVPTGAPRPTEEDVRVAELATAESIRLRLERDVERVTRRIADLRAGTDVAAGPRDLWPDDRALSGGVIEIRDAQGDLVARLRITGEDLERWLVDADVEPDPAPPPP